MNKNGVALAADSASTLTNEKIFHTANKIFTLSKYRPVGIMIFSNSSFMGIPWELIIKQCRKELGKIQKDSIKDYADFFLNFVEKCKIVTDDCKHDFILYKIRIYFSEFIDKQVKIFIGNLELENENNQSSITKIQMDFEAYLLQTRDQYINSEDIVYKKIMTFKTFIEQFGKEITDFINSELRFLTDNSFSLLLELAYLLFTKEKLLENSTESGSGSGIVIAGYGKEEYFPSLVEIDIDGMFNDNLRYTISDESNVSTDFENSAFVVPFAQTEVVETFFDGVDPSYQEEIEEDMKYILQEIPDKITEFLNENDNFDKKGFKTQLLTSFAQYKENLQNYRNHRFTYPIMNIISHLQKDELATIAETLINLTSLKRKVSFEAETVGGPIDVAVISKHDGFVWIKRKHYFEKTLNPQFDKNYFKEIK